MLALVVEPGKVPEARDISGDLKEMQGIVGGYIQAIYPFPGIALVCNEEGWLLGLPGNRGLRDKDGEVRNIIWGTFFLCGAPADGEDFVGPTPNRQSNLRHTFIPRKRSSALMAVFSAFRLIRRSPYNPSVKAPLSRKVRDGGVSLWRGETIICSDSTSTGPQKP